jgi:hypothetical protein
MRIRFLILRQGIGVSDVGVALLGLLPPFFTHRGESKPATFVIQRLLRVPAALL